LGITETASCDEEEKVESKAVSRRNITVPQHRGTVVVSILFCVCGNAEKLLIQSHRSVALKIHFRPNAVAAAGDRKKEKENERKGEKLSFVETACDSRNGASYW